MDVTSKTGKKFVGLVVGTALAGTLAVGCAGGSLTAREKGAGIGALGGAAAGGIIGSAVRHPGAGAAIGGLLGLGAGALIGDQLQGQEERPTTTKHRFKSGRDRTSKKREGAAQAATKRAVSNPR